MRYGQLDIMCGKQDVNYGENVSTWLWNKLCEQYPWQ